MSDIITQFENTCAEISTEPEVVYVPKPCPKCAEKDAEIANIKRTTEFNWQAMKRAAEGFEKERDELKAQLERHIQTGIDLIKLNEESRQANGKIFSELHAKLSTCENSLINAQTERDMSDAYCKELEAKLAEITVLTDLHSNNSCQWEVIKKKLWDIPLPDEPPGSIVHQILSVLCSTTLDLVEHGENNSKLKAKLEKAKEALKEIRDVSHESEPLAYVAAREALKEIS